MTTRDPVLQQELGYRPLQEIIRSRLRASIVGGELRPGERLRILTIAGQYGVSPMPIREALRALEAEGLVEFSPNRGAVVRTLSPQDVKETFLIRSSLEIAALREATARLTDEDFDDLAELIRQMDSAEDDLARWIDLNQEFHVRMAQAAGLPRLMNILTGLGGLVRPYLGVYHAKIGNLKTARAQHAALLRAVRKRDVTAAVATLQEHIDHTRDLVLDALEGSSPGRQDVEGPQGPARGGVPTRGAAAGAARQVPMRDRRRG